VSVSVAAIKVEPVDVVDGRWRVRRVRWEWGGLSGWWWAAAGQNEDGEVFTMMCGSGLDSALVARGFAHRAAVVGPRRARREFGWAS
jgi:hypothetical protein